MGVTLQIMKRLSGALGADVWASYFARGQFSLVGSRLEILCDNGLARERVKERYQGIAQNVVKAEIGRGGKVLIGVASSETKVSPSDNAGCSDDR